MNPQDYLKDKIEKAADYTLTSDEKSQAEKGIEEFIFKKLASKKFRKFAMDEDCKKRTTKAIAARVQKKEPITVVYPQGGYKLWRFPTSPTVDWAEFFNVGYVLNYLAPIAAAYKSGVKITYYMHTLLMEIHDNLTQEEIKAYVDSFEQLLNEFRKFLPENVTIEILRDADIYTRDEYFTALEKEKEIVEQLSHTWPPAQKDALSKTARLNIKWAGASDWTKLSEKEQEEKIQLSSLYEMAAPRLERVFKKIKAADNILLFTKGSKDFIGIGSTKASIAKYWVGFGVLEKRKDSYLPIILTPSQYEKAMKQDYQKVAIDLLAQPNFSQIFIFPTPLI